MSLSKILSGRKRECAVWKYFHYSEDKNISTCSVLDNKGSECGKNISGKNPTNLKKHVDSALKEVGHMRS